MYTGVVIPIDLGLVVLICSLPYKSHPIPFAWKVSELPSCLCCLSEASVMLQLFAGSILTSSFNKTVSTFPSIPPSLIFFGIPYISQVSRLEYSSFT